MKKLLYLCPGLFAILRDKSNALYSSLGNQNFRVYLVCINSQSILYDGWGRWLRYHNLEISLVVQWLRVCSPNAEGLGSIPGQGTNHNPVKKKKYHKPDAWHTLSYLILTSWGWMALFSWWSSPSPKSFKSLRKKNIRVGGKKKGERKGERKGKWKSF